MFHSNGVFSGDRPRPGAGDGTAWHEGRNRCGAWVWLVLAALGCGTSSGGPLGGGG
jgi:hypothetical protein